MKELLQRENLILTVEVMACVEGMAIRFFTY